MNLKKCLIYLFLLVAVTLGIYIHKGKLIMPENNIAKTGTIQSDGFALGYRIEGTGKNALVIGSSLYYPRTFSQNIGKHLRMIFMDHRGFATGPDFVDTSAFALDLLLDDVERVRQELGLGQVIIIGHSGHGYMALEYAKKYPQHVSHVVLIGMGPNQSSASHAAAEQYLQDSVCPERKAFLQENLNHLAQDIAASPEKRFITFCLRLGARSWYNYTFDATPLWKDVTVNMQMFDYVWGKVFGEIDITRGLDNFDKPVFLGLGRYDFLVAPPCSWNPIRSKFKNFTIRIFEKSSHTPQYEEPELFDAELLQWLEKQS